jgi:hypothetical protein
MQHHKPSKLAILQPGDRFLNSAETAGLLGTSIATLNYWRVLGDRGPKFYRHGRNVRYLLSDVTAWGTAQCVDPDKVSA